MKYGRVKSSSWKRVTSETCVIVFLVNFYRRGIVFVFFYRFCTIVGVFVLSTDFLMIL